MQGDGQYRADLVPGPGDVLAEQICAAADEAAQEQPQGDERRGERGGLRQEDVHRRLAVGAMRPRRDIVGAAAMRGGLAVVDDRIGRDEHALAHAVCTPAEVEVIAEQRQCGVEPVEGVPHVAADEHARRADREDIARAVVLALVVLALVQAGHAPSRAGDRDPGLEKEPAVVPAEHLGAEDRDARVVVRGVEQSPQAVRARRAVVVQQPDPLDPVGGERLMPDTAERGESRTDRLAESGAMIQAHRPLAAEGAGEQARTVIDRARVDPDGGIDRATLLGEGGEHRRQPD